MSGENDSKQLMYENWSDSGIDIEIVMAAQNGDYVAKRISEMTPYPWPARRV